MELSPSLLNQRRTKTETTPKQQDHCPLAGTAAFCVCHANDASSFEAGICLPTGLGQPSSQHTGMRK